MKIITKLTNYKIICMSHLPAASQIPLCRIIENLERFHNINLFHCFFSASYFEKCIALSLFDPILSQATGNQTGSSWNCQRQSHDKLYFLSSLYNAYYEIVVQYRVAFLGYHQSLWPIKPDSS